MFQISFHFNFIWGLGPVVSNVVPTNVSCHNISDGSLIVNVNGGTLPLQFNWSNGATTQNLSNLSAGNYTLTILDFNGCSNSISQLISQPNPILLVPTVVNAKCGASNGSITIKSKGLVVVTELLAFYGIMDLHYLQLPVY